MDKIAVFARIPDAPRRFYVDATGGNDANSGRSTAAPWKTIGQINAYTDFQFGDRILFKRGETWIGGLTVPADGLTFGAYGSGNKPIISGDDSSDCVGGNNKSYTRFEDIYFQHGLDFGLAGFSSSRNIVIADCEVSDCGNDNILFGGSGLYINNLVSHEAYERVAGLTITCLELADGADDIIVTNSEFYGSAAMGISIHCHTGEELPTNILFKNCTFHNNAQNGINLAIIQAGGLCSAQASIVFEDCETYSNTQRGIGISRWDPNYVQGVTFRNCRDYGNPNSALIYGDHISFEGCELSGGSCSIAESKNVSLVNCTFYNHAAAGVSLAISGARSENFYGRNNIIMNNVVGQTMIAVVTGSGTTGWDFDYNLYFRTGGTPADSHWHWLGDNCTWAEWQAYNSDDANSPTPANPLFTDAANNDFILQAGSPAIDAGVDVGLAYQGAAPDCGAYEKA